MPKTRFEIYEDVKKLLDTSPRAITQYKKHLYFITVFYSEQELKEAINKAKEERFRQIIDILNKANCQQMIVTLKEELRKKGGG